MNPRVVSKPTLGVKPRQLHERERIEELAGAIERYLDARKRIPSDWIDEYNELMARRSNN